MQSEAPLSPQTHAPRGLKTAGIAAVVIAGAVIALGTMSRAHDNGEAQHWSDARSIPVVHLVPVQAAAATGSLSLPGTLEAWNAAKLYARVGGYVRGWDKDIGATVAAGTPLAQIDTPELDQQIGQARADLASAIANAGLAKSTAARWNDLLTTHSVSQQEADEKNGELAVRNAAVNGARANLNRLLAMKGFATIRSPFAGVVTQRAADIGDLVGPSSGNQQPLFSVADVRKIRIYVSVPQVYSSAIHPGLPATLSVPDYPGRSFTAQVVGQSGAISPQSGAFQVQLVTDNPGALLKPGGYAKVGFNVAGQAGTVQVPASALVFRAEGARVALVGADGHVHLQAITIGRDLGPTVEVLGGLKPGDRVVDNPPDSVSEDELVRVQQSHA
ncbi:efflux RND transporter periplasmic adaptor subunit [Sphingomonas sp. ABOLD]|uniref:RND family efflux transporter MFP subunit n=1 Tax=Sphingomonas trueperi TaxID=53317 RepID=A0A7X5XXG5_9SPHN|nr:MULTISPECIES: efflux RND transporter periplasmic adaptor subunit [Sphingomonas]NJB96805.1 RND family efflux transporter MFP subunit [Sphingomonas trueperi]RSV51918.1 efflux RND transporter periplasmic adaptor subunit [Sphingomonas sp. ABOLD]